MSEKALAGLEGAATCFTQWFHTHKMRHDLMKPKGTRVRLVLMVPGWESEFKCPSSDALTLFNMMSAVCKLQWILQWRMSSTFSVYSLILNLISYFKINCSENVNPFSQRTWLKLHSPNLTVFVGIHTYSKKMCRRTQFFQKLNEPSKLNDRSYF